MTNEPRRYALHSELKAVCTNAYFQPPENVKLVYPCLIYSKSSNDTKYANNQLYFNKQKYNVTIIDKNSDSELADNLVSAFEYCSIDSYFTSENLYHTTLTLYY